MVAVEGRTGDAGTFGKFLGARIVTDFVIGGENGLFGSLETLVGHAFFRKCV